MAVVNCLSGNDVTKCCVPALYADGESALVSVINSVLYSWNMSLRSSWN